MNDTKKPAGWGQTPARPFRRALWRGLAVLCPPLLTVLIIVWAINTTKSYFLEPVTGWAREGLVWCLTDVRDRTAKPAAAHAPEQDHGRPRWPPLAPTRQWHVHSAVGLRARLRTRAETGRRRAAHHRRRVLSPYVELTYLRPYYAIPFFLAVFILLLYFLGKFMAAGIGGIFGNLFERLVSRLPGVRAVYSAVKQVSDFVFTEREIKVTRIVAVEYPRKGIWSMGFVTSESLAAIHDAAGEPVLTVLIPYSPVPVTGCTITVRKSECLDLNITFDQACQFIVSCGVVVPPSQLEHMQSG